MKAMVCDEYGAPAEVLRFADVEQPAIGGNDVLVRAVAASVNPADWHLARGVPYIARLQLGLRTPRWRVLGCDVAGRVEAIGPNVTAFSPGDEVYGCPFMRGFGAFAELVSVPEDVLERKPANLSFEEAAAVPLAAMTALQGLRHGGGLEHGRRILVIGASGGVGTFAVQIAKAFGADVTAVCSTANVDLVRSLGADRVIDYTRNDVTNDGAGYDIVLQVAGTRSPSDCRRLLARNGTLVQISGDSGGLWVGAIGRLVRARLLSQFTSQELTNVSVKPTNDDLRTLKELIEAGGVTPVIDRAYPLSDLPAAVRFVEAGHTRGKVVVTT